LIENENVHNHRHSKFCGFEIEGVELLRSLKLIRDEKTYLFSVLFRKREVHRGNSFIWFSPFCYSNDTLSAIVESVFQDKYLTVFLNACFLLKTCKSQNVNDIL